MPTLSTWDTRLPSSRYSTRERRRSRDHRFAQGGVLGMLEHARILAGPEGRRGHRERVAVEPARIRDGHLAKRETCPFRVIVVQRVAVGLVEVVIDDDGRTGSFGI